jgi:hypothetical protein
LLQVFAGEKIQHNERAIDYCRTVMAIVSGIVRACAVATVTGHAKTVRAFGV